MNRLITLLSLAAFAALLTGALAGCSGEKVDTADDSANVNKGLEGQPEVPPELSKAMGGENERQGPKGDKGP